MMLGQEGRRQLALRDKNNDELFQLYDSDLILRTNNAKNLNNNPKIATPLLSSSSRTPSEVLWSNMTNCGNNTAFHQILTTQY